MICAEFVIFALAFEININPTFAMTNNRKSLSMRQKNLILEEQKRTKDVGVTLAQAALALWAKQNLKLDNLSNQSTVSRILHDENKIKKAAAGHNPNTKQTDQPAASRIEDAACRWIYSQSNCGVMLNAELVRTKCQQVLDEANKHTNLNEPIVLNVSKAWVEHFKKRYGLRFGRVYGEAMSADVEAIGNHMPRISMVYITISFHDT